MEIQLPGLDLSPGYYVVGGAPGMFFLRGSCETPGPMMWKYMCGFHSMSFQRVEETE